MKQFACTGLSSAEFADLNDAVELSFMHTMHRMRLPEHQVRTWFDALEIGETLYDEDGDKWTRTA